MVGGEFERPISQYFGYWWSYQVGLLITRQLEQNPDLEIAGIELPEGAPRSLHQALSGMTGMFRVDVDQQAIDWLDGSSSIDSEVLLQLVPPEAPVDGLLIEHPRDTNGDITLTALFPVGDEPYWYGIVYGPEAIENGMRVLFETYRLFPEGILDDVSGNEGIHLRVVAPSGEVVFASAPTAEPMPRDQRIVMEHRIMGDYQGIFGNFSIVTELEPSLAERLVIGGLPRSNLPMLITLMVLTQIVLIAIFWVLYKERSIARMRSDFVSRVSHEFRTPLTQIRMFAETLLLGRERNPEDRDHQLRIINREAKRLSHMVSNVLTLAGRDRKQFHTELQAVHICELLTGIIDEYKSMLVLSGTRIQLTGCSGRRREMRAMLDPEAFTQVMTNLLDNACKYGPEGQTISIDFNVEGDTCLISVEDEGPGVPESEREQIWQLYYRLEREEERAINGTGIGLPIARELLAAMNGHCTVETASGGGARFVISLERMNS